jgi:Ca2+-binding RTX toxin-like protein
MTSNKDVIALSLRELPAAEDLLVALIRRGTSSRTADLAGNWRFAGERLSGSVSVDSRGGVRGTLTDRELGATVTVSGSVALNANGSGSGKLTFNVPGEGSVAAEVSGALSRAKDMLGLVIEIPQLDEGSFATVLVRGGAGSYGNADVVGTWSLASSAGRGTINFDGKGHLTGGVGIRDTGASGAISGTYGVSADGAVTARFRFTRGSSVTNATLVGRMNPSKNLVIFDGAPFPGAFGTNVSETAMLLRPDGAFATLASGRLTITGTPAADTTGLSVRSGRLNVTQNGVTQKFTASSVRSISATMGDDNDLVTLGGGVIAATLAGGAGKDTLVGGDGNDVLSGDASNDLLIGGNGFDTLYGNDGNDRLEGHGNGDSLRGGRGNDTLLGGTSNDRLFGDGGADLIDGGSQTDTALTDDDDTVLNVENVLT